MNIQCIPTASMFLKRRSETGFSILDEDGNAILDESGRKIAPDLADEPEPEPEPEPEEFSVNVEETGPGFWAFTMHNTPENAVYFELQILITEWEGNPAHMFVVYSSMPPFDTIEPGTYRMAALLDDETWVHTNEVTVP